MMKAVIQMTKLLKTLPAIGSLALLIAGCGDTTNERLVRIAETSVASQAQQNDQLVRQTGHITEASNNLVTADSEARRVLIESHTSLQSQMEQIRSNLDRQRDDLEQERKAIASDRQRAPIIANAIQSFGGAVVCLLPLCLTGYLIHAIKHSSSPDEATVNEVLLREVITSRESSLLKDKLNVPSLEPPSLTNPKS